MYKIDLHTHSIESPDGSIKIEDYEKFIHEKKMDYIAITDHNSISYALEVKKILGDNIIVGEEIMTLDGEIIGLFLLENIQPQLTLDETIELIKKQNGLVYVPHPLETLRKGIGFENLNRIKDNIDIVECYNGRSLAMFPSQKLINWTKVNKKAYASSSDAHGKINYGRTATLVDNNPKRDNLVSLLNHSRHINKPASIVSRFYPSLNRRRKVGSRND